MGYDVGRFLNSPGEFWTCPKCNMVLREPLQICDNSHSVCASCSLSVDFRQCPVVNCSGVILDEKLRRPDATASRFLSSQMIRCVNASNGAGADAACQWVGTVAEENQHAITCEFAATNCPHTGCTFRTRSSALPIHLRTCPHRLVRCPNASLNGLGGSPRKGCSYRGPLDTIDQHLAECTYNPCPQACYGCQFTNTLAMVEQHASECKDLLFQELCELRKRVASQQGTFPPVFPGTQQARVAAGGTSNDVVPTNSQMDQDAAPLLMTPPSTNIPSSELGANEHNPFDAALIDEDATSRQRSTSILDLDVDVDIEDPVGGLPSALERHSISDDEMEDGEASLFEGEAEMLVEAVSEDEEESAEEDESGEEDVLREIGIKTEIQDRGGCRGIAIYVTEVDKRSDFASSDSNIPVSPPFKQGSDTPTVLSPAKASTHTATTTGWPDTTPKEAASHTRKSLHPTSKMVPRVTTPPCKASHQSSSQTEGLPNFNSPMGHAGGIMGSSTVLGYGYMEDGQIFSRSMVPHEPPKGAKDEVPARTSLIKMARDVGPDVDAFGPIRTNMHRRNDAISHGRGSHPYLPNSMHPRLIPPVPPNGLGLGRRAPMFSLPAKPPFMERQYHLPRPARGPGEYQGYPPNVPVPPPYNWPSRQYAGGPPMPAPAHLRGYPPQMRRDFEWEGFEACMTQASSRRPFSTHFIEADYVQPQCIMHPYEHLAMEDPQSRLPQRDMRRHAPSWYPYDVVPYENNHANTEDRSHFLSASSQTTTGPGQPPLYTVPSTTHDSQAKLPSNSDRTKTTEGNDIEPGSRTDAESDSPIPVSIPPQKRPPKISAIPLKPINKTSEPIHQETRSQREMFTPSLLAQPPIEYLQQLSKKQTQVVAHIADEDTSNAVESSDEDRPLAQMSSAQKSQSPHKQPLPVIAHKRKKSTKLAQDSAAAGKTEMPKEHEETLVNNASERKASTLAKRPAVTKGSFFHVPEEEYLARETLVDRPPKLFRKRITRSGKEFHSGDDESNSGISDDPDVAAESPEKPALQSHAVETQVPQAMETVRSPSGIKTRGLKAGRKISSRIQSTVQLAVPIIPMPNEDETVGLSHFGVSEASKDAFVPTRRAVETKGSGQNSLKLKLANPRGRGRGQARGRGIGRGRGKFEARAPRSVQNGEEDATMDDLEEPAESEIQEQANVDPGQAMFMSRSTTSSLSFPISHSRTTALSSEGVPKPSPITPSRLLAAHATTQTVSSTGTGSLSLVDLFSGLATSSVSPVHSVVITGIAPSSTWNAYALSSQLGTDEDSGLASSMDFEFDPAEQLQLDEWTNLANYQDTMNGEF